jgi:hypothetical protein
MHIFRVLLMIHPPMLNLVKFEKLFVAVLHSCIGDGSTE